MVSHLFFYQLVLLALVWLFMMLYYAWPSNRTAEGQRPLQPIQPPVSPPKNPVLPTGVLDFSSRFRYIRPLVPTPDA